MHVLYTYMTVSVHLTLVLLPDLVERAVVPGAVVGG